jgi:hypothetical protein
MVWLRGADLLDFRRVSRVIGLELTRECARACACCLQPIGPLTLRNLAMRVWSVCTRDDHCEHWPEKVIKVMG